MDDEYVDPDYKPEGPCKDEHTQEPEIKLRPLPQIKYQERPCSISPYEYETRIYHYREAATEKHKRRKFDESNAFIDVVNKSPVEDRDSDRNSPSDVVVSPTLYTLPRAFSPSSFSINERENQLEGIELSLASPNLAVSPPPSSVGLRNIGISPVALTKTLQGPDCTNVANATQYADVSSSSDTSFGEQDLEPEKLRQIYRRKATRKLKDIDDDLQIELKQLKRRLELEWTDKKRRLELEWIDKSEFAIQQAAKKKRKAREDYEVKCIIKDISPDT